MDGLRDAWIAMTDTAARTNEETACLNIVTHILLNHRFTVAVLPELCLYILLNHRVTMTVLPELCLFIEFFTKQSQGDS